MKLTPYKKRIILWTCIMAVLMLADAAFMATGIIGKTAGSIIFIPIMGLTVFGDYRISKKYLVREVKNGL